MRFALTALLTSVGALAPDQPPPHGPAGRPGATTGACSPIDFFGAVANGVLNSESTAIVRYLCATRGAGALWPEDPRRRADAERWMDWQLGTLWARMRPVFIGLVRTPPGDRDETALEEARQRTVEAWGVLEDHMSGRDHVLGDAFTMADIPLGVSIYRWSQLPTEKTSMPNLDAYLAKLSDRPALEKRVMLPLS